MCRDSNRYRVDNGDSSDTGQVSPVELCGSGDRVRVLHCVTLHCTSGEEGVIGNLSYMSIFSACFGPPAHVLLPFTHCTYHI